ncbi:hypothetical protein OH77DRAFT_692336 [Trametes cingulata]|nr:hypothetical protein OH77DRAFT_692336 [Trametes cingulata]
MLPIPALVLRARARIKTSACPSHSTSSALPISEHSPYKPSLVSNPSRTIRPSCASRRAGSTLVQVSQSPRSGAPVQS